jgi:hypothetical protein
MKPPERIVIPREVLLIEIERRCSFPDCNAKCVMGLTKEEAIGYKGFACVQCKRENTDHLTAGDAPEWWAEIAET